MHLYTGTTLTKTFPVSWMKTLGSVTGFVANDQIYIAIGAGMGQGSLVTTYTTNGTLQRQFDAFDGVTDGVVLSHIDAYDGQNGVLVEGSARQASRPIKIYSESVLLLKEYPSAQKAGIGAFSLLVDQPLLTN